MKTKLKNQSGFTIIEVLIVLAIAGLIMLVVFLAVPALQRNQRNSGRRTDGSRIAAAANDFVTNSNGSVPSTTAHATSIVNSLGSLSNLGTLTGATGGTCSTGDVSAGNLRVCSYTADVTTFTAPAGDGALIATGARCSGNAGISGGSGREMSVLYTIEGSGTTRSLACVNI